MAILAKECPLCGGKMMPPRCASYLTTVDDPGLPIMERHMKVLIYTCETCRYVAIYNFREYSDEKLQQVIDGRGYVPEAKKAAKQLLYRRRYGE